MKQERVVFSSKNLSLEGVWHSPEGEGLFPTVVLCHPHSLHGGNMDVYTIRALAQALVSKSIAAFRFNFRGVGKSEGSFDNGVGEQTDLVAALDWLNAQPKVDTTKIGVAGYSFGAAVAARVTVKDRRIGATAFISLPLADLEFSELKDCTKPKFFIWGDNDFVASTREIELFYRELSEPKELELVSGADHFWRGFEKVVAEKAASFFSRLL